MARSSRFAPFSTILRTASLIRYVPSISDLLARSCEITAKKHAKSACHHVRQQAVERGTRPGKSARIAEQADIVVNTQDDGAQLKGDRSRIPVGPRTPSVHRLADRAGELAAPLGKAGQNRIAHRTRPVVVFDRATDEQAAGAELFLAHPVQPAIPDCLQPRQS